MLLSIAQKGDPLLNIMSITTASMPHFIYNYFSFNDCISIVRTLQL